MLIGVDLGDVRERRRYFWGLGQRRRPWRESTCSDCLEFGSCTECKRAALCGDKDCKSSFRILGYNPEGFSGITDSIADAAKSVAGCPIPFVIGIGVGYLIKKSGMLKKITL